MRIRHKAASSRLRTRTAAAAVPAYRVLLRSPIFEDKEGRTKVSSKAGQPHRTRQRIFPLLISIKILVDGGFAFRALRGVYHGADCGVPDKYEQYHTAVRPERHAPGVSRDIQTQSGLGQKT